MFEDLPGFAAVVDRELRVLAANRLLRETFGEVVGEVCYRAIGRRDAPCVDCPALLTFVDGDAHALDTTVTTPAEEQLRLASRTSPVRGTDGAIEAVLELFTPAEPPPPEGFDWDPSHVRQRYEILFNEVPCYISVQDREFRLVESNHAFRQAFGEPRRRHCYKVYKRRPDRCPVCPVAQTFEDGQVHSSEELVTSEDGRTVNVIVYSAPIRNAAGEVTHAMEMSTDISEVRKLQSRLASLGQLVAGVSHSVKGILMGLDGGVYVVNSGFQRDDRELVKEGWAMVERNVERVSKLVQDILFYAKERKPEKQSLRCRELVTEIGELFAGKAQSHGIALEVRCPDESTQVVADPKGLHSLLVNLLENALDACLFDNRPTRRHRIELSACRKGPDVVLRVSDNGVGMDKATRERVFDPQFSTKGSAGTGLGLMVAQKVATEHGGTIQVRSTLQKGTTFTVRIPAAG